MPRWPEAGSRRVHVLVAGIVQGVGFRPFLHRLASRLGLGGWARNTPAGVELELEGPPDAIEAFVRALRAGPPPLAVVEQVTVQPLPACRGETAFAILPSTAGGAATARNAAVSCTVSGSGEGTVIKCDPNVSLYSTNVCIPAVRYAIPEGRTVIETEIKAQA